MPVIKFAGGGGAIICDRRSFSNQSCNWCNKQHHFLCDYPTEGRKTCDKLMCLQHSIRVAANTDYCPDHAALTGGKVKAA